MRGIETAFWGVLGKDPELKTSKTGKAFATMNVVVTVGQSDDNKDVSQWLRVACFGETAERIGANCMKGDRIYCEGNLTLNTWKASDGTERTGLNVAAFTVTKVAAIGKNRPRKEYGREIGPAEFAGPAQREKPRVQGRDNFELDDELPF
ncbi:MAG: single-stranded DNA-binding protein [Rhodomicrobium sp.]